MLTAELLKLHKGGYTLKSSSLGIINIDASKIRAIHLSTPIEEGTAAQKKAAQPSFESQIQGLQYLLTSNPEVMTMIASLLDDPDVQEVLADPALMKAIKAGDLSALLADPQFMQLLRNPTVQDIRKKVAQ